MANQKNDENFWLLINTLRTRVGKLEVELRVKTARIADLEETAKRDANRDYATVCEDCGRDHCAPYWQLMAEKARQLNGGYGEAGGNGNNGGAGRRGIGEPDILPQTAVDGAALKGDK